MSAHTVKRKPTNARQAAAAQAKARKVHQAKSQAGSLLGHVMARVPLSEDQWHKVFITSIIGAGLLLAWAVAVAAGVPVMLRQQVATIASSTGFEVRRVEVRGVNRLNELKVYERALAQRDRAITLVNVDELRNDLMELSWIEDARVSRQLPDTLVIDVVERKPYAVLRLPDKLVLIDGAGNQLEPISAERAKSKLILSGLRSAKNVEQLTTLLEAAPALRPLVQEAAWVGNRRWDLTFNTGQVLALPEGVQTAADAFMSFARLDGTNRLLGGKVAAFDMRSPDRMYMRIPGRNDDEQKTKLEAELAKQKQAAVAQSAGSPELALADSKSDTAKASLLNAKPKAKEKSSAKSSAKSGEKGGKD